MSVIPLSNRKGDYVFIGYFAFALCIAPTVDIINAIGAFTRFPQRAHTDRRNERHNKR